MIAITVQGANKLERKLVRLEPKLGRKVIKQSLRAGAKIVLSKTKAIAPVGGSRLGHKRKIGRRRTTIAHRRGYMKQAIVIRAAKKNRPGIYAILQVFDTRRFPDLVVKSKSGRRAFYPAAVEYGHAAPGQAGGAKVVAAKSFVLKGFKQSEGSAKNRILRSLKIGIERTWRRQ